MQLSLSLERISIVGVLCFLVVDDVSKEHASSFFRVELCSSNNGNGLWRDWVLESCLAGKSDKACDRLGAVLRAQTGKGDSSHEYSRPQ
jgi:hypothetical protein